MPDVQYNRELSYFPQECERAKSMMKSTASNLLKPRVENLEAGRRPGMVTLIWVSIDIESCLEDVGKELD